MSVAQVFLGRWIDVSFMAPEHFRGLVRGLTCRTHGKIGRSVDKLAKLICNGA